MKKRRKSIGIGGNSGEVIENGTAFESPIRHSGSYDLTLLFLAAIAGIFAWWFTEWAKRSDEAYNRKEEIATLLSR